MRVWCVVVGLWLHFTGLQAQGFMNQLPAISSVWSHFFYSPQAVLINPAMAAIQKGVAIRISGQHLYNIQDLKSFKLGSIISVDENSTLGIVVNRFGNSDFQDILTATSFGKKIGGHFMAGISIGVESLKFKGYSNQQQVLSNIGICWVRSNMSCGITGHLIKGKQDGTRSFIQCFTIGLGKDWSSNLYSGFSFSFGFGARPTIISSIQYLPASAIILGFQVENMPARYSFEAGWVHNKMRISIIGSWLQPLGYTTGIEIGFTSKKDNAQ